MKIYVSQDDKKTIRKNYHGLITDEMFIIDTPVILEEMYPKDENGNSPILDKLDSYMINQLIEKRINSAYNSKRFTNILYLIDKIDRRFIYSFRKYLKENNIYITDFILIDYAQILDEKIYKFFDNVL